MSNELTAIRKESPQPPLPVPAPRPSIEAADLHVDVLSTAPLVVGVSGEIDIASAPKLREELLGALRRHEARLTLDLGGVTFMDCAGVNALLAARRHARLEGGWVRVARASRRARHTLILTGLHGEFALAGSDSLARRRPQNRPRLSLRPGREQETPGPEMSQLGPFGMTGKISGRIGALAGTAEPGGLSLFSAVPTARRSSIFGARSAQ